MLDGYDDALNDCLRDPDLCLAEQFFYDPSVSCTAMQNAETMPWPDISCAESCVETMVKDQRPDLSTCSDPVTAAMIEAPTLFKSFFEEGSDGRACVDKCIEQNAANPFTITCSATETLRCTTTCPPVLFKFSARRRLLIVRGYLAAALGAGACSMA